MGCVPQKTSLETSDIKNIKCAETTVIYTTNQIKISPSMFVKSTISDPYSNYEIVALIGEGSYGRVHKVRHRLTNEFRAMKIINKNLSKESQINESLIINEIKILMKLDHPNIIKVYEYYNTQRKLYLITELCTGGELFDKIIELGYFSENVAVHVMKQIFSAVCFCHLNNIVHRDLKPENILIESKEEATKKFFTIKIIDFGTSEILKNNGLIKKRAGTPYYIAPEVINSYSNEKCDLWSCGVIMYILLSGKPPFNGNDDKEIFNKVKNGFYCIEGEMWDRVSSNAKDLIKRLLTKDYKKRISAEEALKHPWFYQTSSPLSYSAEKFKAAVYNLQNFRAEQKLQQAVLGYIIHNLATSEDIKELRDIFLSLDTNFDGRLSREELKSGLIKVMPEGEAELEIKRILKTIDVDDNGYIEYEEFLRASIQKSQILTEENLQSAFKMFDRDNSGKISASELKLILGGREAVDEKVWSMLISEVDLNGDGEISFEEFRKIMNELIGKTVKEHD